MSTNSKPFLSRLGRMLLLALPAAACSTAPPTGEADQAASSEYKAKVRKGVLTITGSEASSRVALRLQAPASAILAVDVGDDGVADLTFDRATFNAIVVDAGGGDDVVRVDEVNGVFTVEDPLTINGGNGNDTLVGGHGAETFFGGAGDDTVVGGAGADVAFLGDGNDTFVWNPGDGSDVVEGEGGSDSLAFAGANVAERIELLASGGRLRFTRDIGLVAMDVDGVERVAFDARGGADTVLVRDLSGTAVARVDVDLAQLPGTGLDDGSADVVSIEATPDARDIDVTPEGAAVVARGLAAVVAVTGGTSASDRLLVNGGDVLTVGGSAGHDDMSIFPLDADDAVVVSTFNVVVDAGAPGRLVVDGGGGDDTIFAANGLPPIPLVLAGGDGNDVITGGTAAETIFGGPGDDTVDGGAGADLAFLGDGDDTFIWNPGGGSDLVEGEAGDDRLLFLGSAVAEKLAFAANGPRLRLTRDIGQIVMDVDGVERAELDARDGADSVVVNDLAGTAVAEVDVNLEVIPGSGVADGQPDVVTLAAAGTVDVAAEGAAVVATGPAAVLRVTGGGAGPDRLVVNGTDLLNVNGSAAHDDMSVFLDGANAGVSASGFNVVVEPLTGKLAVNGLGGDDTIIAGHALPAIPLQLDGGDGNDLITGGDGAELLLGGAGNDTIDGGPGADLALLGAGDDTFIWNPGGGSDTVEGQEGDDALVFFGSNIAEQLELGASGPRVRLTRDVGLVTMDLDGIERTDVDARAGADRVTVNDLGGTAMTLVNVDLAAIPGDAAGDGQPDEVIVNGSAADDTITAAAEGLTAVVSGLAATVRIAHAEAASDRLVVNGRGGLDTLAAAPGLDSLILFTLLQD